MKKTLSLIKETKIPGLLVIEKPIYSDSRGFFREVVRLNELNKISGINFKPVQVNHSLSLPNVIRGLHAENWNKLVYMITGKVFCAIVDIREDSKTFSKVETFVIDESKPKALFIPSGLANSICVLGKKPVHYLYLVDRYYDGRDTRAIAWNDPDLNIDWPIKKPIVSDRDKENPRLKDMFPDKFKDK
jgi:dTDP-4-dehydrorhamnose 3,5-epimerase